MFEAKEALEQNLLDLMAAILDLGDGRYALYAHLKPGSVSVREGERVQQGQMIGELGNSGNSTGPHLHFHVMDSPSGVVADGVPYVFADFELTGTVPPLAELIELDRAQEPVPVGVGAVPERRDDARLLSAATGRRWEPSP